MIRGCMFQRPNLKDVRRDKARPVSILPSLPCEVSHPIPLLSVIIISLLTT